MSSNEKKHGFHLVDPSPWPIYVSFATLILAFGAVYYFHSKALWLLLVGFALVVYGAVFYMATGFHGFHVVVGTIFLAVCLWRGKLGHFTKDHHFGFEAAAWYWHFVDVVWLFLFAAIYIWGS